MRPQDLASFVLLTAEQEQAIATTDVVTRAAMREGARGGPAARRQREHLPEVAPRRVSINPSGEPRKTGTN
jgi:hypothetical protein